MPRVKSGKQVGVNVVARFRPCDVNKHLQVSKQHKFEIMGGKSALLGKKKEPDHLFHLDMMFNDTSTQKQMFEHVGEPIVRDVLHGYNGTIFAYGQTGSGKTHSLFGDMSESNSQQRGIIPRSCELIFHHFEEAEDIEEVTIKMSFIEIYKEKLQDLLIPDKETVLKIRENPDKSIYVQGVHEEYVSSFEDVFELLQVGFRNRVVASTLMNQCSSRSHCVLTLNIKQTLEGGTIKTSKVNFADLAGSEKVKKTGATGDLLEQAKAINLSLSALGNVISALTTKGKRHIPYRDSVLTFLLQDALGGNTKTSLVVTCSSESYNFDETLNTMRFATRAKEMTNKVKVNKVMSTAELQIIIGIYRQKLGKANAIISRLQSLVKLMRSAQYNPEQHGEQIDEYLNELAKVQQAESTKNSKRKPALTSPLIDGTDLGTSHVTEHEAAPITLDERTESEEEEKDDEEEGSGLNSDQQSHLVVEQKEDARESGSESQSQRMTLEMEDQMMKLNHSIDAKDKVIEGLEEEIRILKSSAFAQNQREQELQNEAVELQQTLKRAQGDEGGSDASESQSDSTNEHEKRWRESVDEQSKEIGALRAENESVKKDRIRLLLWNQELQKRLDHLLDESRRGSLRFSLSPEEAAKMRTRVESEDADSLREVTGHFEHQLGSLRKIMSKEDNGTLDGDLEIVKDIRRGMEPVDEERSMEEMKRPPPELKDHKMRAEQTAIIMYNLQQKLEKLPELNTSESRDLVDAAVTSIRCLLDSSMIGKNDLETSSRFTKSRLSSVEIEEIDKLKRENEKLIKKLADMKTTWIAHLDMLMQPSAEELDMDQIGGNSRDIGMSRGNTKIVKPIHQKSAIKRSRGRHTLNRQSSGFGLKKMIGYLSGALLQYFGQVAVLRGPLWMCNRKVALTDFKIDESDYKKVYVVLTKNEMLGYRSLLHAESDTKSPLFQHSLRSFVSVLRIEEMMSAMTIVSPTNGNEAEPTGTGVFIVSMVNDRVIFKAEGNLSREVWMDNLEALLTD